MNPTLKRRRALVAASLSFFVLLTAVFAAPAFFTQKRGNARQQKNANTATTKKQPAALETKATKKDARTPPPSPAPKPDAPATTQEAREADAALGREITRLIEEGDFAQARWGVSVVSLRDGRVVYARDARRLFTPASNMKLFATAAALDLLGADYRWRTSVYAAAGPDAQGTIAGDLVLYGRGAPDLSSRVRKGAPEAHLSRLAEELKRRGVRRVRGGVVGDESYFRGETLGDGWQWNDVQWYYGAEVSALSIDDNEITLTLAPADKEGEQAKVRLTPPSDYVRVTNDMNMVKRGERSTIGITRTPDSNEVRVWGDFPSGASPYGVRLSVHRPALWAARLFRDALRARGIEVEGEARLRDARTRRETKEFDVEQSVELASVSSRPLVEVVRETNKKSLNLQAELLLRTIGAELGDKLAPLPDPQRARQRNADTAGLAVIGRWLKERAGVEAGELAMHDGSGLSRLNLVTPESFTRLLAWMAQTPSAGAFRASLPNRDGTLEYRLRNAGAAAERIHAKTGTLTYINSLSGYADTAGGEPLAFSIICNDETGRDSSVRILDAIAALIASHPDAKR
ncbi:MAG TPA: D-alanyl-D-alanine carboxypeptidase/D-alanyl-D-alanine-endopeptidase [Pyrinomonadaceae bacterium]|jgi:D-alanyl-D-alanine carboxypeptidase/D-alanyl-D-alanine-endopeptidase (penicillin-binding protein 4)|nr:D-alanyl-D-alanine carboxypeptidase/D-alanyl-D-alanine-endopeptidase [Pyrinomonadaceae bacterium]